ncbi:MAG: DUF72 domain-containing protein [Acidobacteriota bacterium]
MMEEQTPLEYGRTQAPILRRLAERGLLFGTSSWKYDGWRGIVYGDRARGRGISAFLHEYASIFPTVCADFTFYRYYDSQTFSALYDATPEGFSFALKVPQALLIDRYPDWFKGEMAGKDNPEFLDAEVFVQRFLEPARELEQKLGPMIFEFGEKTTSLSPADFMAAADAFFTRLPRDALYAVEVRRKSYLTDAYFEMLRRHNIAHVVNSQESAPPMDVQLTTMPVLTARHCVVRALTRPRVGYKKSVSIAEPYDRIVQEYPEGVTAMVGLARRCESQRVTLYAYINNRLEGCAPLTISKILAALEPPSTG